MLTTSPPVPAQPLPVPAVLASTPVSAGGLPDSSSRIVLRNGHGDLSLARFDAAGTMLAPVVLQRSSASKAKFPEAGLLPAGGAVVGSFAGTTRRGVASLKTVNDAGAVVATQKLAQLGPRRVITQVAIGPTGAVAVVAARTRDGGADPVVLFRPAGATAFGAPVRLGPVTSVKKLLAHTTAVPTYDVTLSANGGGGIVIQPAGSPTPAPILRSISPSGVVGPALTVPVGRHDTQTAKLAVSPSGTLVAAVQSKDTYGGKGTTVTVVTLPASATALTPAQQVFAGRTDVADIGLGVAVDATDRATVIAGRDASGLLTFTGPANQLAPSGAIPTALGNDAVVLNAPDGSTTAVWEDWTSPPNEKPSIVAARRAAGAASFGPPRALTEPYLGLDNANYLLGPVTSLPNGDVEATFTNFVAGKKPEIRALHIAAASLPGAGA